MAAIVNDSKGLYTFSSQLSRKRSEIDTLLDDVTNEAKRVNSIWRDQKNQQFMQLMNVQREKLRELSDILNRYANHVNNVAKRAEEVENVNM